MQVIGNSQVRVVPDVSVSGSNGSGLLDAMMGMLLWNQTAAISENSHHREQVIGTGEKENLDH